MAVHNVKKGLDLPIIGEPEQSIDKAPDPRQVALVAADYVGLKPTMHVQVGDSVRRGQRLFEDKKNPGVVYTSPAAGKVVDIHRGRRRALQSLVIELAGEGVSGGETVRFAADTGKHPAELSAEQVRDLLVESGLWTALRARPFGKVASPSQRPRSVFVNVMDTHPLAPDPATVMAGQEEHFARGVTALSKLAEDRTYVCVAPGLELAVEEKGGVSVQRFAGPHPAGTVGLHIHTLDPVDRNKLVWYAGYQDVIAIGKLFANGGLDVSRVISLAGPLVRRPRLLRTRIGAHLETLTAGELEEGQEARLVSGSVLSGRQAYGAVHGYLGRYHQQVSVLAEGRQRELLGWMGPGIGKFSTINAFLSRLFPKKRYAFTTTTHGSDRAIVPIGMYERVFPLDIPASFLMRSLAVRDTERAEELGCLELEEEDVALCSFVCPGKHDYGPYLRDVLTTIEKEG